MFLRHTKKAWLPEAYKMYFLFLEFYVYILVIQTRGRTSLITYPLIGIEFIMPSNSEY